MTNYVYDLVKYKALLESVCKGASRMDHEDRQAFAFDWAHRDGPWSLKHKGEEGDFVLMATLHEAICWVAYGLEPPLEIYNILPHEEWLKLHPELAELLK